MTHHVEIPLSTPIAPAAVPPTAARRLRRRLLPFLLPCAMLWLTWWDGRLPPFLSPTVERTLYFKLPIDGTRFHWAFLDRSAFLSGELTLRIVNADRDREQSLVIFRNGRITAGWKMIGGESRDSSAYFGFATGERFATAVDDSIIVTLIATEDLRGRGPYSQGTLARGTWVATGTYTALYGGTLNPLRDVVRWGKPPIAFLGCWDTTWVLRDARDGGWIGPKPPDDDSMSVVRRLVRRLVRERGVDGRRCRLKL